jgi:uncharacterized protein (DUF2147 family)
MRPILAGVAAGLITAALATTATAADPFGTYERPSTKSQVQFYACGGNVCAKVVKPADPSKKEHVGKVIMSGAAKSGDNTWKGDLLNLEDGKTYSGTLKLVGPKQINLQGCTAIVLCKDETWNKVN